MDHHIQAPTPNETLTVRLLILFGLASLGNFFYWFLRPEFMDHWLLYGLLLGVMAFDSLRIIYIWYHYWELSVPKRPHRTKEFTVDVLTTYFPGEPYDMVEQTLLAIQKMSYPHTTYLCDEANDPHLKQFCKANGVIHVTRNNRIDAKAGNINHALKQAHGEICLILDPDHVPVKDFLDEVVPYFEDDKIGFVQSVQAYYNVDESRVAKGAAQQTFHFYGPIMMSMNSYGTVNAIGANCVFRRKALDSIGGHAAGLAEDMHTAMQLYAEGWKSVYVPEIFTKGLVPATLTSYYKQQLKWSRGTMELLLSVYPKLFKRFSWRQRIHFGILPLHYLSGFTVLLTLLIPILSLVLSAMPWKGNILTFGYIIAPVLVSVLAIQYYVQRWVMDRSEWGMHAMGGVLLACTWWVNVVGVLYTLIRKNVPYLPTPKEDQERTSWKLLVPNLIMGVLSLLAVMYGLSVDRTPFSIFMSGFAVLNAVIMFFTMVFAREKPSPVVFTHAFPAPTSSMLQAIRQMGNVIWQKAALPLVLSTCILAAGLFYNSEYVKWAGVQSPVLEKNVINYLGIFSPRDDDGLTHLDQVSELESAYMKNFDIISLYLPWEKNLDETFPDLLVDSIYGQQSIPMITWEPWQNSFTSGHVDSGSPENAHVYNRIIAGEYDDYISRFAHKLKELEKPMFLRFAHEFDNPFYPWFMEGREGVETFKQAWIHTYEIFKERGAHNVIWIWNPWKAESIAAAYPGQEYVDWIGVNVLNYAENNPDGKGRGFEALYQPFHEEIRQLPLTPVVISEFGSLGRNQEKVRWMQEAFSVIEDQFTEIKSVIYFNSPVDDNWPAGHEQDGVMDWTLPGEALREHSFRVREVPMYVFTSFPALDVNAEPSSPERRVGPHQSAGLQGVNLKQGFDWRNNYHVLDRRKLEEDFRKIQQLGMQSIKITGNSVYDYNVLNISREAGLDVTYGFWIPPSLDFMTDSLATTELAESILEQVRRNQHHEHITSWNIQGDVLYNQKHFYHKPSLLFQNRAYVRWVADVIEEIERVDPTRSIILDLETNNLTIHHAEMLLGRTDHIDQIGLVVKEDHQIEAITSYFDRAGQAYLYSEIPADRLLQSEMIDSRKPFFVTAWQDQYESNKLTFDGLADRKGRLKVEYHQLRHALTGVGAEPDRIVARILKPARGMYEGDILSFRAMLLDDPEGWREAQSDQGLSFEWSLVKRDEHGNYLAVREIGSEPVLSLRIPNHHEYFDLLLTVSDGQSVVTEITTLNTPLVRK